MRYLGSYFPDSFIRIQKYSQKQKAVQLTLNRKLGSSDHQVHQKQIIIIHYQVVKMNKGQEKNLEKHRFESYNY